MILFVDLPDEISAYIDEFIQYQRSRNKFKHYVIPWIEKPKYKNSIVRQILYTIPNLLYQYHFCLNLTWLNQIYLNFDLNSIYCVKIILLEKGIERINVYNNKMVIIFYKNVFKKSKKYILSDKRISKFFNV